MLETTRKSKKDSKNFFLKQVCLILPHHQYDLDLFSFQLTDLLMQVKGGSKPYLPQIFEIIRVST